MNAALRDALKRLRLSGLAASLERPTARGERRSRLSHARVLGTHPARRTGRAAGTSDRASHQRRQLP